MYACTCMVELCIYSTGKMLFVSKYSTLHTDIVFVEIYLPLQGRFA